ncbi:MAG: hypothetical protein ACYC38_08850 [Eubacteriales bacterium]
MDLESVKRELEVVCIEVLKVYDFCFQTEHRDNVCTPLGTCKPSSGATVTCTIHSVTCSEVGRSEPDQSGRSNVTLAVTVIYNLEVFPPGSTIPECSFADLSFGFTKTVNLCAPTSPFPTTIVCEVPSFACGPCLILGTQICCSFDLCLIIQSVAPVKLLVPSFGFCVPSMCEQVSPTPPIVCPPQLFPMQCPPLR